MIGLVPAPESPAAAGVPRLTAEERESLRAIAERVGRAAHSLVERRKTRLPKSDLEAIGMRAVWERRAQHDPSRGELADWAFYVAIRAMMDASRGDRRESLFASAVRRGLQQHGALEARAVPISIATDTLETDLGRLRARTRELGVSAWLQPILEGLDAEPAPVSSRVAADTLRLVRDEIARFSDEQRKLLRLRFWESNEQGEPLSAEQLSAAMGIPARTLQRRWNKVRELLVARLAARGVTGIPEGFGAVVDATPSESDGDG